MNKEEEVIIKILEKYKYDCDGTELKNIVQEALISFMDYTKIQDLDEINRFYRIYALMYWAIKDLQSKLDIANNKIDKIKEYITLHTITEEDLSGWHTVLRDIEGILSIIGSDYR